MADPPIIDPYQVTTADEGASIVLSVTATNTAGTVTTQSAPTSQVPFSSWVDITGATDTRYGITTSDVGHQLRLEVTATNTKGEAQAASLATTIVTDYTVTFVAPLPGAALQPGAQTVTVNVQPTPGRVSVNVDGGAWKPLTHSSGATWTGQITIPSTVGDHTIDIDPSP